MNGDMNENRLLLRDKFKNKASGVWALFTKTGRAICLGGVVVALSFVTACGNASTGIETTGNAETDIGNNWRYTGEELWNVFNEARSDEGVIYVLSSSHGSLISMYLPITVMQATKNGNLVQCGKGDKQLDRLIWVVSSGKRYLEGEPLRDGYYIRRGFHEYKNALGAERTVARYVEVTDEGVLSKIRQQIEKARQELAAEEEAREAQRKAEKEAREAQRRAEEEARKEAAEQGAYELDIPVKSLCGFKLGAPPSQVQNLLQHDNGTPVLDLYKIWGVGTGLFHLAKPFRLFTRAEVEFMDNGVGMHLKGVTLSVPLEEDVSSDSYDQEAKVLSEFIEKKFGIKFECSRDYYGSLDRYYWEGENEAIEIGCTGRAWEGCSVLYLTVEVSYDEMSRLDREAIRARKRNIHLDNDAGFDDL